MNGPGPLEKLLLMSGTLLQALLVMSRAAAKGPIKLPTAVVHQPHWLAPFKQQQKKLKPGAPCVASPLDFGLRRSCTHPPPQPVLSCCPGGSRLLETQVLGCWKWSIFSFLLIRQCEEDEDVLSPLCIAAAWSLSVLPRCGRPFPVRRMPCLFERARRIGCYGLYNAQVQFTASTELGYLI
ncbi:hypothetical protein AV530_018576 [Patagioenas fasciata monilis]|uniref:Secreted protein n=1 Tax=Patagioenas fasciata monilis TaxID=372326 RepID=A0A1V4JSK3_PATFA|nr:hypothetical protein AV530_018576 [Patagioenas fasciata monilis]